MRPGRIRSHTSLEVNCTNQPAVASSSVTGKALAPALPLNVYINRCPDSRQAATWYPPASSMWESALVCAATPHLPVQQAGTWGK
jgi:hypothetical protein